MFQKSLEVFRNKRFLAVLVSSMMLAYCGGSSETGEGEAEVEGEAEGEGPCGCADPIGLGGDLCDSCETYCDPSNSCSLPNADVQANAGDDNDEEPPLEAADYECLAVKAPPAPPKGAVNVTGETRDYLTRTPVPSIVTDAFPSSEDFATPCATVTSDESGVYVIPLPESCFADGDALVSWRMTDSSGDQYPTFHLNQRVECESFPCTVSQNRPSVSETTVASVAFLLRGTEPLPGTSIVIGDVVDCQGRSVQFANGRLFDAEGSLIEGIETYYFQTVQPVRRNLQSWTSPDGLVAMIDVPAGSLVEISAFGRLDGEETVLSTIRVPPVADSIVVTEMEPLYSSE